MSSNPFNPDFLQSKPHAVTDSNFDTEVLNSEIPVLVDFWAEWCRPCQALMPVVEEIAKDYSGRVKVTKMNIEENPGTPGKYAIVGIPTLLIFKGGKLVGRKSGTMNKNQLSDFLNSHC